MSYWAQLDKNNKVLQVLVGEDDLDDAYEWIVANVGGRWVQTIEANFAGIGWTYIEYVGFYPPKPFESWTLNGLAWQPPNPKPEGDFIWDEALLIWVAYELS
jgi:hypothetical protein